MRVLTFCMLLAIGLFSCVSADQKPKKNNYTSHILGLASPIQLNYDSTLIFLTDYFPEASGIEKIELEGSTYKTDTMGRCYIVQQLNAPISNLVVTYKGVTHDIPVFKSEKQNYTFTYKAANAFSKIEMAGSMNGWNRKATPLRNEGDTWTTDLILTKGLYQYRLWMDDQEKMDDTNPNTMDNGMGGLNNTFQVGESVGETPVLTTVSTGQNILRLQSSVALKKADVYLENKIIPSTLQGNKLEFSIPADFKKTGRSHIRVFACTENQRSNDILIPLENGVVVTKTSDLNRQDMHSSIMYFMMVDRFVDGDTSNNAPTPDPSILPKANNYGGDLKGITQKIKDGYFKDLGINTVWISPITQNANGAWGLWNKGITSKFSAYHGYWPTALRSIDPRFGSEADMKELLDVAHANNMNVILDYVAHHVHQDHPLYKQNPDWTTPLYLPDGRMNTELWDEQRLTTWFDTFLPTWNFARPEVVHALTDTAMYWVENYDLDGFRHDATKHIPESFWRELTSKVKNYKRQHPDRLIYQVGETYGNPELISSYIGSGQMDAQFDFNLYDAAVDAFAKDETNFNNLQRVLAESMKYYGSHHLMGNITGNQDRTRFTSYADGSVRFDEDPKLAGWTREIANKDSTGFLKMRLLSAFIMTTPGIPCIYYGDEIGMPGANDPDNRRMMHFGDWNTWQQELYSSEKYLVNLRKNSMALTYGDLITLHDDETTFVFARKYFDEIVVVAINKSSESKSITVDMNSKIPGYAGGNLTINVQAWSYEINTL